MDWLHKFHLQNDLKEVTTFEELKAFVAKLIERLPEEPNPEDE